MLTLLASLACEIRIAYAGLVLAAAAAGSMSVAIIRAIFDLTTRATEAIKAFAMLAPWASLHTAAMFATTVIRAVGLAAIIAMESRLTLALKGATY